MASAKRGRPMADDDNDEGEGFSRQWKRHYAGRVRGDSELYDPPTPEIGQDWYGQATKDTSRLEDILSHRQRLENSMRIFLRQNTTPDGRVEVKPEFLDGLLWLVNFFRTGDVPELTLAQLTPGNNPKPVTALHNPPTADCGARTPPPTPQKPTQTSVAPGSRASTQAYTDVNSSSTGADVSIHSPPLFEQEAIVTGPKGQLWLRLANLDRLEVNEIIKPLMTRSAPDFFADTALKPGLNGSVADLFQYSNRIEERTLEDRLRKAIVALAWHELAMAFKPPPPALRPCRVAFWHESDYVLFYRKYAVGTREHFAAFKKCFSRMRKLGQRYAQLALEHGEGTVILLLPYMTEKQLLEAPASGEPRDMAMRRLRSLKVRESPVVRSLNMRVAELKSYLKGETGP